MVGPARLASWRHQLRPQKKRTIKLKLVRDVRKECGSCHPVKIVLFLNSFFWIPWFIQLTEAPNKKVNGKKIMNLLRVGSNHQPLDCLFVTVELFQIRKYPLNGMLNVLTALANCATEDVLSILITDYTSHDGLDEMI
jgi:hypothetical protein